MKILLNLIKERYIEEFTEDKWYIITVYNIWFNPINGKFADIMYNSRFIKKIYFIIKFIFFRIFVWWPFCILAYMWNVFIRYMAIPLQEILYYYSEDSYWISKLSWLIDLIVKILSSLLGLTILIHKIIEFWTVTRYIWLDNFLGYIERKAAKDFEAIFITYFKNLSKDISNYFSKIYYTIKNAYVNTQNAVTPFRFIWFRRIYYKKSRRKLKVLARIYISTHLRFAYANFKYQFIKFFKIIIKRWFRNFIYSIKVVIVYCKPKIIYYSLLWLFLNLFRLCWKFSIYVSYAIGVILYYTIFWPFSRSAMFIVYKFKGKMFGRINHEYRKRRAVYVYIHAKAEKIREEEKKKQKRPEPSKHGEIFYKLVALKKTYKIFKKFRQDTKEEERKIKEFDIKFEEYKKKNEDKYAGMKK